jgi:crossover junction endodeoxyribonuclease RuvC
MKRILGIDPGLASTGYGVICFDGNRYTHLDHGLIATSPDQPVGARLLAIHQGIRTAIGRFRPDEAAIETVYFARNSTSAIPVAQARGVILFTLAEQQVPFEEYTPVQVKQAVIGRGKAQKRQMQEILRMILGLETIPHPDHSADALAVAICHANTSGELRRLLLGR